MFSHFQIQSKTSNSELPMGKKPSATGLFLLTFSEGLEKTGQIEQTDHKIQGQLLKSCGVNVQKPTKIYGSSDKNPVKCADHLVLAILLEWIVFLAVHLLETTKQKITDQTSRLKKPQESGNVTCFQWNHGEAKFSGESGLTDWTQNIHIESHPKHNHRAMSPPHSPTYHRLQARAIFRESVETGPRFPGSFGVCATPETL